MKRDFLHPKSYYKFWNEPGSASGSVPKCHRSGILESGKKNFKCRHRSCFGCTIFDSSEPGSKCANIGRTRIQKNYHVSKKTCHLGVVPSPLNDNAHKL
jgi:hypothetical protein